MYISAIISDDQCSRGRDVSDNNKRFIDGIVISFPIITWSSHNTPAPSPSVTAAPVIAAPVPATNIQSSNRCADKNGCCRLARRVNSFQ